MRPEIAAVLREHLALNLTIMICSSRGRIVAKGWNTYTAVDFYPAEGITGMRHELIIVDELVNE